MDERIRPKIGLIMGIFTFRKRERELGLWVLDKSHCWRLFSICSKFLKKIEEKGSDWKVLRRKQGMDSPFLLLGKS